MSIVTKKLDRLEYLVAESITVPHCFTTRLGGVSTGHLESLNLSMSQGDAPENVVENYRRVGQALGFLPEDVVMACQTHSDIVVQVGRQHCGAGIRGEKRPECDAFITGDPGVALFVSTADCTPILLHDPVTGAVGAAHAGWRGTAAAIGGKTVEAMVKAFGCDPKNIRAAIGPNIGACCFETDADVPEAMLSAFGEEVAPHIEKKGEKYHLDLKAINAVILRRAGVQHIDISENCTMCEHDRFWSHRYTKGERGSQGAIIVCKEASK